MKMKTSKDWCLHLFPDGKTIVYDPDGWDRLNYDYSFNQEKITEEEFNKRLLESTVIKEIK